MSAQLEHVPLELLDPDPRQPRGPIEREDVIPLAKNIREFGQLQPAIVCRNNDRYIGLDCHRRAEALRLLKRTTLWALVLEEQPAPAEMLMLQLSVACHRSDLKPLQQARAFERLKAARAWSNAELADSLQLSRAMVTQCLSYLTLSAAQQEDLDAGRISRSTGYAIARAPDEAARAELAAAARAGGLTRDEACRQVRRRGGTRRVVCRLGDVTLTVAAERSLTLPELGELAVTLRKEVRAAAAKGFDVRTFERVLADQQRAARDVQESSAPVAPAEETP
ncbi:MAG: ParB/RepB/Spo0J family partition protein [Pirellulales bacterium]